MNIISMTAITYFATVAVSYIMEFKRSIELFKDVADAGYKFSIDKTKEMSNDADIENIKQINNLELLIPIRNLMTVLERYQNYYDNRNEMFETLIMLGLIEEMTEEEKEEYNKKRTGFHAIVLEAKRYQRMEEALKVILIDGSTIWFEYNPNAQKNFLNEITILKVEGRISFKSEQEQKKSVFRVMAKLGTIMEMKYKNRSLKLDLLESKDRTNNEINEEEIDKILKEIFDDNLTKEINSSINIVTEIISKKEYQETKDNPNEDNNPKYQPKIRKRKR